MIVKILSSARNFEGVDYSERKNDQGRSELLKTGNFEALEQLPEITKADYISYMRKICDANPNVKNRQFHAVISTRGDQHSPEQLAILAEKYLRAMGYGDNPYLIYFHKDTDNNHVHMVSTRVDKQGKKVDDTFEKIRSQKVMQAILGQQPEQEAKRDLAKSLTYTFSTEPQFRVLLEHMGYKTTTNVLQVNLIRYGIVQTSVDKELISQKIQNYQAPRERLNQLNALFHKYSQGRSLDQFQAFMKEEFGISMVLHQSKNHEKPYGYTVIDHAKKHVFKGSQVMDLSQILQPVTDAGRKELLLELVDKTDFLKQTLGEFRDHLIVNKFRINDNGEIECQLGTNTRHTLSDDQLKQLKYNDRLEEATRFHIDGDAEKSVLARYFHLRTDGFTQNPEQQADVIHYYAGLLKSLDQRNNANEGLSEHRLEILRYNGDYFLLDREGKYLVDFRKLGQFHEFDFRHLNVTELDRQQRINLEERMETRSSLNLPVIDFGQEDDPSDRKSKKRKQLHM